jgi:uncharacterized membrane protein (DUF106 family)
MKTDTDKYEQIKKKGNEKNVKIREKKNDIAKLKEMRRENKRTTKKIPMICLAYRPIVVYFVVLSFLCHICTYYCRCFPLVLLVVCQYCPFFGI